MNERIASTRVAFSSFVICHSAFPVYFSRSERFGASFHLSGSSRTNQRARSERTKLKNSALNEKSRSDSGQNNNAKSH